MIAYLDRSKTTLSPENGRKRFPPLATSLPSIVLIVVMYNLHHLSHVVQLFGDICIYVSRFLTNMIQRFSDFYTTHRNITLTFITLWVIFASKIIRI